MDRPTAIHSHYTKSRAVWMVSARMSFNADLRGRRFGNTNILQYHWTIKKTNITTEKMPYWLCIWLITNKIIYGAQALIAWTSGLDMTYLTESMCDIAQQDNIVNQNTIYNINCLPFLGALCWMKRKANRSARDIKLQLNKAAGWNREENERRI